MLTSDEFADWFAALEDKTAEDVATVLEVVERLGPARAHPTSHEWLLWYEHPGLAQFEMRWLQDQFDAWLSFHEYAKRIVDQLESARFVARMAHLSGADASAVVEAIAHIKDLCDPRRRALHAGLARRLVAEDLRAEVRRWYLAALAAAGLEVSDVPAHSPALRELSLRASEPAVRLLYGVDAPRERALFVLGERLDRSCYGASVRRAEQIWNRFLAGELEAARRAPLG